MVSKFQFLVKFTAATQSEEEVMEFLLHFESAGEDSTHVQGQVPYFSESSFRFPNLVKVVKDHLIN